MTEIETFLTIQTAHKDLPDTLESWKESTYEERRQSVIKYSKENRGYPPAFNMNYLKRMTFEIERKVELHHLFGLIPKIQEKFGIECFQISIDRKNNLVHMLFDWYDRENNTCRYIYKAKIYNLTVMIIQSLDLPYPFVSGRWLYYFLKEEFDNNPDVFDKLDEWVKHQNPSAKTYSVLKNLIEYGKERCQEIIK